MRLESQHRQRRAARLGLALGFGDQGAVAAMHAVEIADRHHRAAQARRHVLEMAEDAHQAQSFAAGRWGASTMRFGFQHQPVAHLADAIQHHARGH